MVGNPVEPIPSGRAQAHLGSFARPISVRGSRLTGCPYHDCGGDLTPASDGLYECQTCRSWFRLLPLEEMNDGDAYSSLARLAAGARIVTSLDIRRAAERHRRRVTGDAEDDLDAENTAED